jgi:hypothetical protein
MFVWGGIEGSFALQDTGAFYDSVTAAWTPITGAGGPPSTRVWHTAVWTGTHMLVWGGRVDLLNPFAGLTNTGAEYTDTRLNLFKKN